MNWKTKILNANSAFSVSFEEKKNLFSIYFLFYIEYITIIFMQTKNYPNKNVYFCKRYIGKISIFF